MCELNIEPHALERFYERVITQESPYEFFCNAYKNGRKIHNILDARAKRYWAQKENERKIDGYIGITFYKKYVVYFDYKTNPTTVKTVYPNDKYPNMLFSGQENRVIGIKMVENLRAQRVNRA